MCDECYSGISESELMDRLEEALNQRDELMGVLQSILCQCSDQFEVHNRFRIHAATIAVAKLVVSKQLNTK